MRPIGAVRLLEGGRISPDGVFDGLDHTLADLQGRERRWRTVEPQALLRDTGQ